MRSGIWEKIADNLNKCSVPKFTVDKRSVCDHVGNLVNKHKKKLRDEEKATGIAPDEPSEPDNALDTIIALEESADAEVHEADTVRTRRRPWRKYQRPGKESRQQVKTKTTISTINGNVDEGVMQWCIYPKELR